MLFSLSKICPSDQHHVPFLLKYIYIEELLYCTLQYEINKIRKYKMSHINKMLFDLKLNEWKKKISCKKIWCNTDKINEQKKKLQNKIAQTYVN